MQLYDTHCHLAGDFVAEAPLEVLRRARAAGVERFLCVATDLASAAAARDLGRAEPGVRAAAGVHPNELGRDRRVLEELLNRLEGLAGDGGFAAVGETGLDFYRERTPPELQLLAFRRHLDLAARLALPVVIHCRAAAGEVLRELRALGRPVRGVMHCYSEGPEHVADLLALGLHISFAGNLTYPKAAALRAAAAAVPADRLLVETDTPFLPPQPVRGRSNEPAYLAHTVRELAAVRGATPQQTASTTFENASRLFG